MQVKMCITKLNIQVSPGKVYSVIDPYLLTEKDWIEDTRWWPQVTYPDIYTYLRNSSNDEFSNENLKNYKSLSAYDYVQSGKVQTVKMYNPTACGGVIILSAEVQPSQHVGEKNHVPWAIVEKNGVIMTAHCTCMAGIGEACSHVAALLFKVELAVRLQLTSERTPTEEACKWNSTFSSKKVLNVPVSSMNWKKKNWHSGLPLKGFKSPCFKRPELPPLTEEDMRQLEEINPEAVIFQCKRTTKNNLVPILESCLPPTICEIISCLNKSDIINEMKTYFSPMNCKFLAEKTTEQRICKLWHQHRQGRFTASIFKEIVKKKKWNETYMIKFMSPFSFSAASVCWGREKEAEALQMYTEYMEETHSNVVITKAGFIVNPDMPHLGATPDAFVRCSCCGEGVVELKCPYKHRNSQILAAVNEDKSFCLDASGTLKESHEYFYQVQGQMAITQLNYCDLAVWTTKDLSPAYTQR